MQTAFILEDLTRGVSTTFEFDLMKRHTIIGERLCGTLRSLAPVRAIVRHHHELLDGSGYPDGLRGDAVPLLAQIVAIADVYDAITTTRPYRIAAPRNTPLESSHETSRTARAARTWSTRSSGSAHPDSWAGIWLLVRNSGSDRQGRDSMALVLFVDDDASVRQVLARWITSAGHTVREAESADAALADAEYHAPAAVFCDVRMPGRDGVRLTGELRQQSGDGGRAR